MTCTYCGLPPVDPVAPWPDLPAVACRACFAAADAAGEILELGWPFVPEHAPEELVALAVVEEPETASEMVPTRLRRRRGEGHQEGRGKGYTLPAGVRARALELRLQGVPARVVAGTLAISLSSVKKILISARGAAA
jgi:hypothetical protein